MEHTYKWKSRQKYCMYNLTELYKNMYLNGKKNWKIIWKLTLFIKKNFLNIAFLLQNLVIWYYTIVFISSVQLLSCVQLFVTSCTAACQASLSITNSWSLLKLMSIESLMSSNHLISAPPAFRRHLHGISMYLNGKQQQQQQKKQLEDNVKIILFIKIGFGSIVFLL